MGGPDAPPEPTNPETLSHWILSQQHIKVCF